MEHLSDLGEAGVIAGRVGRQVRLHRAEQGLTSAELAERSGLSRTILARIERGDGNPSLGTLWRISRTLRVPIGALVGEDPEPLTRVIRAGEGAPIDDPSGMVARLLHGDGRERRAELFSITLPPGAVRESASHFRGVEELLVVTDGVLSAGPDTEPQRLASGDALWFAADVAHRYEAAGAAASFLCWMLYPPSAG